MSSDSTSQQEPLTQVDVIITGVEGADRISGNNNATYGPVPRDEQLFRIELLEIAPSPIPVDQIFFVLLRGYIPPSKEKDINPDHLAAATLSITLSALLSDGEIEKPKTYAVPLRTTAFRDNAHISIRDEEGNFVDGLTGKGNNDIVTDFWIPGMFLRTGRWTFEVVGRM
ncbi:uncharacterized protein DNG_02120 [Cephalotrichum gorgonifer]|uniref:Uncharacterized protein n=1 Tax=Cephalotrichum gorgonifer TaxID=2041049 RepID=A0AAE8MST6_9PEZI|nr:uncharacterized protein DNG_02120 [Cephalotrichum gorgonifer]